jgi:hypothetical protein
MKVYEKRHFKIRDTCKSFINCTIIHPYVSDQYVNDVKLGISLVSDGYYEARTRYPFGTMYIMMPSSQRIKKMQSEYERAWMAICLSKSQVHLDDVLIAKLYQFMSRIKN